MQDRLRTGAVRSVNVGAPREIRVGDTVVRTSIWKGPVAGRVAIRRVNIDGDDQSDRRVHGGDRKAVYAYASEDLAWWSAELERELAPGTLGENLTLEGVDVTGARVGERWEVGTAVLEVTQPRLPCYKLELRLELPGFIGRFIDGGRPGAYLRIVEAGTVAAGDPVTVLSRPDKAPTVADVMRQKTKRAE
ncbi:MAG TPA: MOSC domain-containing protein [Candidatus Limnocylindria bacterium]|nr:MOSC domain-containing protein [Candidatus Limnocylindria bacterium]